MTEVRVGSWADLLDALYAGSWKEGLGRWRSSYAFRGLSKAEYGLTNGVARLGDDVQRLEGHILRNFRKYAQRAAVPRDSVWNWLALAQHHGLPTRLLDWTYSPFVALHFATEGIEDFAHDGVIWMVDYSRTNRLLPGSLQRVLRDEGSDVFTAEMLECVATSLAQFDALAEEEFVVFLEPPSLDDRIVNQFALFSLLSNASGNFRDWLTRHPSVWRRVVIPAELKWEVRDKLDQANITERVLYPGLDGLTRWLKRYYTPRKRGDGKSGD